MINHEVNPRIFINYSQTIDDVYENLEDYNPTQKRKVSIGLDYMMQVMEPKKKLKLTFADLLMTGKILNISGVSYSFTEQKRSPISSIESFI